MWTNAGEYFSSISSQKRPWGHSLWGVKTLMHVQCVPGVQTGGCLVPTQGQVLGLIFYQLPHHYGVSNQHPL